VKQVYSPFKPELTFRRSTAASRTWKHGFFWQTRVPSGSKVICTPGSIRAVISNDDKALEQPNKEADNKEVNGTVLSSTSDKLGRGGIDVRAVITIRKKMKEKINEKIEDQWEYFINGIGRGISIQLVSEEIDPGNW